MTFDLNGFQKYSQGEAIDCSAMYGFTSAVDNVATIAGAGYFNQIARKLAVGDVLYVTGTNGAGFNTVTAVAPNVTVSALAALGPASVGTANLDDGAVTSAKAAVNLIQASSVALTAVQFRGMFATPIQLVAAQGANRVIRLITATYAFDFGATQYANGGVVTVQYGNTIEGNGPRASDDLPAVTVNGINNDRVLGVEGAFNTTGATAAVNAGLFLSNKTAAFTAGDTPVTVYLSYAVLTTTF